MVETFFKTVIDVTIPIGISGGGWNAKETYLTIPKEESFKVTTKQTPVTFRQDFGIIIHYENEEHCQSFETLGRLIACGAIQQTLTKKL